MTPIEPVMLCGLTWHQAYNGLRAIDCAIRRPHWCSPVVILHDGQLTQDDDGELSRYRFYAKDRWAKDWMLVPRVGDDGEKIAPTYRAITKLEANQ